MRLIFLVLSWLMLLQASKGQTDRNKSQQDSCSSSCQFLRSHIESVSNCMESIAHSLSESQYNENDNNDKSKNTKVNQLQEKVTKLQADVKQMIEKMSEILHERNTKKSKKKVYNVTLADGFTFEVFKYKIANTRWIVIQQRINGGVDFNRNWNEYKDGFGDFWKGDFFLGLEKIHRLTNEEPHELYINMEYFNGTTIFAKYGEFAISSEQNQYRLSKLSKFTGNTADRFHSHRNMRFSTHDRDNDNHNGNCASFNKNGWWYDHCASCNLNGKYFETEVLNPNSVHWDINRRSLKKVRMLIRPKAA